MQPNPPTASPCPRAPFEDLLARSVIVVDDENGVRDLMSRFLRAGGYSVASASGAAEALGLMQTAPAAVVLCDIRMPGRDGLWLADRIRQQFPETAVIMATGVPDACDAAVSRGEGMIEYLTKPFGRDRLSDAVTRGIQWHRSARDSRCWRERLDVEVSSRHSRLAEAIGAWNFAADGSVEAMVSILTVGDRDAYGHARRVAVLADGVAQAMGLALPEAAVIRQSAMLHDLGKLAMPEALLRKPSPLTPEEQSVVRRCPQLGSQLIASVSVLEDAAQVVLEVRERPDGLGYPARLRAAGVSLAARIVSASDAYDTMIHQRVFRDALGFADALLELERCSGTQFDPDVVRVLKRLVTVN